MAPTWKQVRPLLLRQEGKAVSQTREMVADAPRSGSRAGAARGAGGMLRAL